MMVQLPFYYKKEHKAKQEVEEAYYQSFSVADIL